MIIVLINLLPQVTKPKTRSIRHRRLSCAASAQIFANRMPLFGTPHTIIICVKNEPAPWLVLFTLAHNDQSKNRGTQIVLRAAVFWNFTITKIYLPSDRIDHRIIEYLFFDRTFCMKRYIQQG